MTSALHSSIKRQSGASASAIVVESLNNRGGKLIFARRCTSLLGTHCPMAWIPGLDRRVPAVPGRGTHRLHALAVLQLHVRLRSGTTSQIVRGSRRAGNESECTAHWLCVSRRHGNNWRIIQSIRVALQLSLTSCSRSWRGWCRSARLPEDSRTHEAHLCISLSRVVGLLKDH